MKSGFVGRLTCVFFVLFLISVPWTSSSPALRKSPSRSILENLEPLSIDVSPQDGLTVYHSYDEVTAELSQIATDHGDIVRVQSIGKTAQMRDIWAVEITDNPGVDEDEPEVLFIGNHHAREWMSVEVPMYVINFLVDQYAVNQSVKDIVDHREIWVLPTVNPDGRVYDGGDDPTSYRNWRKNRVLNDDGSRGVDPNRNYGYFWGAAGASDIPSSQVYRGKYPFSEKETRAVRDFCREHDFVFAASYHSFSQLILWPWGGTDNVTASDDLFTAVAHGMADRMTNRAGSSHPGYTPTKGSNLYFTSGDTTDWLYGELGVYAFTIELYPSQFDAGPEVSFPYNGFHPREDKVLPVCEDNLGAALYLMRIADNPYQVMNHITLSSPTPRKYINATENGSFQILLLNDGNESSLFHVSYSSIPGWSMALTNVSIPVPVNSTAYTTLSVDVPPSASPGTYPISVNATSLFNSSFTDTLKLEVVVPPNNDVGVSSINPFAARSTYPMGNYSFTSTARNYGKNSQSSFETTIEIRELGPSTTTNLIYEDAESPSSWTVIDWDAASSPDQWHRVSTYSHSGSYSWWVGNDATGRYRDRTFQMLRSPPFSLGNVTGATFSFYQKLNTEPDYDYCTVEIGYGNNWTVLASYSGNVAPTFQPVSFDISRFVGQEKLQVRFRFTSDEGVISAGWYVDDISIDVEVPFETTVFGPASQWTSPLPFHMNQTMNWRYKFIQGGDFKIVARTNLTGDENPNNDEMSRIISIDPGRYRIFLQTGWNLVSSPLVPSATSPSLLLSSLGDSFVEARVYNSSDLSHPWKTFSTSKTYGDLNYIDHKMAIWIRVSRNATLDMAGLRASSVKINLTAGWNFVGYPSLTDRRISDSIAGLLVERIEGFSPALPYHLRVMSTQEYLITGRGYWFCLAEDAVWVVSP